MTVLFSGLYSEGVASHSPGLPRIAATLGGRTGDASTPTGLRLARRVTEPRWGTGRSGVPDPG